MRLTPVNGTSGARGVKDLRDVKGVLFDVDDTLFDYSSSEEAGLLGHLREQGLLERFPSPGAALALWRSVMEAEYARYLTGELTFRRQQYERTRRFLAHLGQAGAEHLSDEQAAAWFAGYGVHRDAAWQAFPDARPTLARLAPRYRLGVVSNSDADHQRRKLRTIGLLEYVGEVLVCSDQYGEPKPAPGIFLAGCAGLGLAPHEVAYVGDKYTLDAEGARDAGLHAFWLDRAASGTPTGEGIHTLHTLDALLRALAA
ncbi:HAD family hydrolase [Streptomyces sp. FH025]|uniref:HAD family hydrolase n=1 Tax=Streptomyces sp. FH025 TaxID=2815937 RepID=UPI001A9EB20F|nr:HAD family hydrolase [Streptomyces sp. FH025]MBO1419316.1 HAD family hydrolase [Streptomyces sp. FH025]